MEGDNVDTWNIIFHNIRKCDKKEKQMPALDNGG